MGFEGAWLDEAEAGFGSEVCPSATGEVAVKAIRITLSITVKRNGEISRRMAGVSIYIYKWKITVALI